MITSGHVNLGKYSHIGVGAIIKHGVPIGNNTIIGGNSLLINYVKVIVFILAILQKK